MAHLRFTFITACVTEGFFDPVKKGMRDAAALMQADCTFIGTEDVDIPAQIQLVRDAINQKVDGIALNMIHATAFNEVVSEALDRGIPVVGFNVDAAPGSSRRLSAIRQDFYQAGVTLGSEAASSIPRGSTVLATQHAAGVSALDDRLRGIQDALRSHDLAWRTVVTGNDPEPSAIVVTNELETDPTVSAILCTGQADTEGVVLALTRGFQKADYYVAGFDLSPVILDALKTGLLKLTIDQQPYAQGFYPVIQLALYCRYGIAPSDMDSGASILTPDEVDRVFPLSRLQYR